MSVRSKDQPHRRTVATAKPSKDGDGKPRALDSEASHRSRVASEGLACCETRSPDLRLGDGKRVLYLSTEG
jgi:hypothetical protein